MHDKEYSVQISVRLNLVLFYLFRTFYMGTLTKMLYRQKRKLESARIEPALPRSQCKRKHPSRGDKKKKTIKTWLWEESLEERVYKGEALDMVSAAKYWLNGNNIGKLLEQIIIVVSRLYTLRFCKISSPSEKVTYEYALCVFMRNSPEPVLCLR